MAPWYPIWMHPALDSTELALTKCWLSGQETLGQARHEGIKVTWYRKWTINSIAPCNWPHAGLWTLGSEALWGSGAQATATSARALPVPSHPPASTLPAIPTHLAKQGALLSGSPRPKGIGGVVTLKWRS